MATEGNIASIKASVNPDWSHANLLGVIKMCMGHAKLVLPLTLSK